jgi:uncharacterized protein YndB with AHSA1/START domain
MNTDRIEKQILLRAPRERVWRAITDSREYGTWTTLVQFELQEAPGGTLLIISESGFEQIPLERRAAAFTSNDAGWSHQARLIEKYLALPTRGTAAPPSQA